MSINRLINDSILSDIGDAIREKNGLPERYHPQDMAEAIRTIDGGGGTGTEKNIQTSLDSYDDTSLNVIISNHKVSGNTGYDTVPGVSIVVKKTGIYKISWAYGRSAAGDFGTRLSINGMGYGREFTQFVSHQQIAFMWDVPLTVGDLLEIHACTTGGSRTCYANNLIIIEQ